MNAVSGGWTHDRLLQSVGDDLLRIFFVGGGIGSMLCAVLVPVLPNNFTPAREHFLVALCLAMTGMFVVLGRTLRGASVGRTLLAASWSIVALTCLIGVGMGEGIHALENQFFCVLTCMVCVLCGRRAGALMAGFAALWILSLAAAERLHWIPGAALVAESSLPVRLVTLSIVLASAVASGLVVRRLQQVYEDAMNASERGYRMLFEQLPAGTLLHRGQEILDANGAARAVLPALASHAPGVGEASAASARQQADVDQLLALGQAAAADQLVTLHGARGGPRVLRISAVHVGDAPGVHETLSMFVDDTERQEALRASARASALLRNLVATSPDAILLTVTSPGGEILLVNDSLLALLGSTSADVVGRRLDALGVVVDLGQLAQLEADITAWQRPGKATMRFAPSNAADAGVRTMEVSANAFDLDGVRHYVIHARDITEIERERREQQAILDHAGLGIALTHDLHITRVNAACGAMAGRSPESMQGMPGSAFLQELLPGEDVFDSLRARLARGEQVDVEERSRGSDGRTSWYRFRGRAIDDRQGVRGDVWIVEDVTERRAMQQALADARDAAEEASRAKSAFLANTSHEIRTPLNGLVGLANLLTRPTLDEARTRHYLSQMLESAQQLGEIMDAILDMAKIESGKLVLEAIRFEPVQLLQELHARYAPQAAARNLSLALQVDPGLPAVLVGDPLRVGQILGNYLANALKFTSDGSIVLRAEMQVPEGAAMSGDGAPQAHVRFTVEDTGIGIAPETLPRLFHPFTQADDSSTRRYGGTGLGLSICRELALLMGGTVGVHSALGEGSTFRVDLPFPLPSGAGARAA